MARTSFASQDLLDHLVTADTDALREICEHALQRLIELEAATEIGAERNERTESRLAYRNRTRPKMLDTRVGRLEVQIPKLRTGSFFPSLLEPRRRIERALVAVVQEAYVHGVSTRKVDDLVAAMGGCSISKSQVSRICHVRNSTANSPSFATDHWMTASTRTSGSMRRTRRSVRVAGFVSKATVVAMGVRDSGEKCILGIAVGASETEAFWMEFCRSLLARGLTGVLLAISDAHEGLRKAIAACFAGASWQRCKVHFLRNVAAAVTKQQMPAVLAVVKTIFLQPTPDTARSAVQHALTVLEPTHPKVAQLLRDAEEDLLAYLAFPAEHWRSISSTNALERVNAELARRARVVGIFPNSASLLRLSTAVLQEQHDEWQDGKRAFPDHSMQRLIHGTTVTTNLLTEGIAA